eukprot:6213510-Pleurochrysis_carterae.AAC.2
MYALQSSQQACMSSSTETVPSSTKCIGQAMQRQCMRARLSALLQVQVRNPALARVRVVASTSLHVYACEHACVYAHACTGVVQ